MMMAFGSSACHPDATTFKSNHQTETVCCLLEKQLVEPFDPGFHEILESARDELRPLDTED
jgi:hypothetical protein